MSFSVFQTARFSRPFLLVSFILAVLSSNVIAQEKTLAPVVVTATRAPQVAADVLSDVVVITSEEIERSGDKSLVDLLQRQRGIEVARNGGRGANASVFIRGAEDKQNVVLVDGVRVGSSTTGGANWSVIPLSQIERIEIVYGPLSSLYGAGAMGGVVQIFTKKGRDGIAPTASVTVGSYGTRVLEAGISGAVDRTRFSLVAAHEEAKGFSSKKPGKSVNPDRDGYTKDSANGNLGFEFAKGHEVGVAFLRSRQNAQYDSSAIRDDRSVQYLENYALTSQNKLSPSWTSRVQLARTYDKRSDYSTRQSSFNTRQTQLSWQNDVVVGTADLMQFVVERRHEKVDSTSEALNRERSTNSAALAYQFKRGPHLASFGLRNDDSSQFGAHTTGSIGYGYRITSFVRANASLGTSFRAPTFNELYATSGVNNYGVPTNRPERGRNAELGLIYERGERSLTATFYRNRISDLIVRTVPCPLPGYSLTLGCPYNVNDAQLAGLTLAASTRFGNFVYRATADFQNPEDMTNDQRLARRARAHGTVAIEYDAGGLAAGAEGIFSGNRLEYERQTTHRLPGYGLVNLYASYAFTPDWSLFGRWNNVFDKDYELARGYNTEGSSVFVGVRYTPK